ncbi:DUF2786 domain-containing protein [Streptomyces venezuelae]|uniref:Uncharacterized protein n=1 Tax=Streptomyces venezuelae TaxID=54571 RepID=A0A5P2BFJ6_STRVZ|nr:DUF2786 domain-containing protein [Streptomyces venezuelae]QES29204.1 hypothetical protein DEJ47_24710 [Streptomyces venezuelae]
MSNEATLAKIRAILAKAEDPGVTPEESEAYFGKAAELMGKYGIERAMLAASDPTTDKVIQRTIVIEGSYASERRLLAGLIAKAVSVEPILSQMRKRGEKRFTYTVELYGFESDIERAEMLYASLSLQASNGLRATRPEWWESTTLATHRKAWLRGFTYTVVQRIKDAEARAKGEAEAVHGTSVALVLADRAAIAKRAADEANPSGVGEYKPRTRRTSAFEEGSAAGRRADIGAKRVGTRAGRSIAA